MLAAKAGQAAERCCATRTAQPCMDAWMHEIVHVAATKLHWVKPALAKKGGRETAAKGRTWLCTVLRGRRGGWRLIRRLFHGIAAPARWRPLARGRTRPVAYSGAHWGAAVMVVTLLVVVVAPVVMLGPVTVLLWPRMRREARVCIAA